MSTENLTGIWHGQYEYPRSIHPPVFFTATLVETGGALTGSTSETDDSVGGAATASLRGERSGSLVTFVKSYDRPSATRGRVAYEGALNADATEIEGRWIISAWWSGRFLMIRSTGIEEAVTTQEFERA